MVTAGSAGPRVRAYGDAGLLVEPPPGDPDTRWRLVQDLGAALLAAPPTGLVDVVAAYDTVLVTFDPLVVDHTGVAEVVRARWGRAGSARDPRVHEVPVCYGAAYGPDLVEVAAGLGLAVGALVELHTGSAWTVRFRGSPVGAPFLDGPVLPGPVPRRASPRTRVDPGSVGMSGRQSMVYPVASPGGWSLVGRTPLRLADPARPGLVPYRPGDRVRFVAIDAAAFAALDGRSLPW